MALYKSFELLLISVQLSYSDVKAFWLKWAILPWRAASWLCTAFAMAQQREIKGDIANGVWSL